MGQFRYVDLFAGIGGFHAALSALGGECVFVSEIDDKAAAVYAHNWGDEVVPFEGDDPESQTAVHGDINEFAPEKGEVTVPAHEVLAAGFPCQPFSKSGAQMGVRDRTRGTLFFNILRILEKHTPEVIFLENVRNLAGPRHQDTWDTIIKSLRELGYRVSMQPTVFSPHLLHPRLGGSPQVRDRVFILGVYVGPEAAKAAKDVAPALKREPIGWETPVWSLTDTPLPWNSGEPLLLDDSRTAEAKDYRLTRAEVRWIDVWDDFVRRMLKVREGKALPGFPLWADDWRLREDLEAWKIAFPKAWRDTPSWKQVFLNKNADFYTDHADEIDAWRSKWFPYWATGNDAQRWTSVRHDKDEDLETGVFFPASRRKLEWQAQDKTSLRDCVLHLRPSGIRAKQPTYLPALVAITQTSVLAGRARRLMPREAARLQGLPDWFEFKHTNVDTGEVQAQADAATYKQLGNGVAAGAVYYALRTFLLDNLDDLSPALQKVVLASPETPDIRRRPRSQTDAVVATGTGSRPE